MLKLEIEISELQKAIDKKSKLLEKEVLSFEKDLCRLEAELSRLKLWEFELTSYISRHKLVTILTVAFIIHCFLLQINL